MAGCTKEDVNICSPIEGFASITIVAIIMTVVVLTFFSCVCIKIRDMMLRAHLRKLAKRKGIMLDLDKLNAVPTERNVANSQLNENCTILIPDVAIVM